MTDKVIFIRRLKNGLSTSHPLQSEAIELLQLWFLIRKNTLKVVKMIIFFVKSWKKDFQTMDL